ncbi:hypothetical protein GBAR_LOCUS31255 [Geodia barretti]|uniref:Uncharacterized protein n=1 Tax=Geodia barretti TaxID=519541 RepID=A0AA35XLC9_GEOBA|nr:hypothetical protein GBAR_LOCUS31255 [Geodia barretti]
MPVVVEVSGKENIVPVRLLSREARLYQRRFRDGEGANFYTLVTLPSCHRCKNIANQRTLVICWHSLRSSIPDRGCLYLLPIFVILRSKETHNHLIRLFPKKETRSQHRKNQNMCLWWG